MSVSGARRYQFRIAAMGLVWIIASFVLMVIGALPLAAGLGGGNWLLSVVGLATFGVTAWLFVRCTRISVIVSPEGLAIRNLVRTYRFRWSQIADVRPRPVGAPVGIGQPHVVLTVGVADASLTRLDMQATRTVVAGSGVRLFPLLAVLDLHAEQDDFSVDHHLPGGAPLPGSPD